MTVSLQNVAFPLFLKRNRAEEQEKRIEMWFTVVRRKTEAEVCRRVVLKWILNCTSAIRPVWQKKKKKCIDNFSVTDPHLNYFFSLVLGVWSIVL